MKEETQRCGREDLKTLLLMLLLQAMIIPLKNIFYNDQTFSVFRFMVYELLATGIPLTMYLVLRRTQSATPQKAAPSGEKTQDKEVFQEEKKSAHVQETIAFLQERVVDIEKRKEASDKQCQTLQEEFSSLQKRLEDELSLVRQKLESSSSLIRKLSSDLRKQSLVIEGERKKHALEIRALLRRASNSTEVVQERVSSIPSSSQGVSVEGYITALLTSCADAFSSQDGGSHFWPSSSYPHLLRRKLSEEAIKLPGMPTGVMSVKSPLELLLSCQLQPIKQELLQIITEKPSLFCALQDMEPLYLSLGGRNLVFFRCSAEPLEDLLIFGDVS